MTGVSVKGDCDRVGFGCGRGKGQGSGKSREKTLDVAEEEVKCPGKVDTHGDCCLGKAGG